MGFVGDCHPTDVDSDKLSSADARPNFDLLSVTNMAPFLRIAPQTALDRFRIAVAAAAACVLMVAAEQSGAEDVRSPGRWSRFRGLGADGSVETAQVPTRWSDSENLLWKATLPGRGSSSPVLHGDRIYLTAYSGYGLSVEQPGDRSSLRLHVLCVSANDGRVLWSTDVDPAPEEQPIGKRVAEHGYASPTACVGDDGVYAYFGPSGLVALDHQGKVRWRRSLGTNTKGFGAAASPMLYQDLVIQNASIESGRLVAMNRSDGEIRWENDDIQAAWTTPTLVRQVESDSGLRDELIINQKGEVRGLAPETGKRLWNCLGIQDYVVPCVIHDGPVLYCSGGRSNRTLKIRCGGNGDVSDTHLDWEINRGANVTTPLLHDGHLYWSHDKALALCVRASDGEEMFRERLPTRSRVYASIVADAKHLFLTTRDEGVVVLQASPGYTEVAVNRLGGPQETFNATPAIEGGRLYLRSDQALYCVASEKSL